MQSALQPATVSPRCVLSKLHVQYPPPQVLSDDNKRAIYDRYGEAGLKGGMGGFPGAGGAGVEFTNPFDLFESFFGGGMGGMGGFGGMGGRARSRAQPGSDEK